MAHLIDLPTFTDERGKLTVIEKVLPFDIKRVYFIYDAYGIRGGHSHKQTQQAVVCIKGYCEISVPFGKGIDTYKLNSPHKCLVLKPADYHTMHNFSENAVLLVMASHNYDADDYIHTPIK